MVPATIHLSKLWLANESAMMNSVSFPDYRVILFKIYIVCCLVALLEKRMNYFELSCACYSSDRTKGAIKKSSLGFEYFPTLPRGSINCIGSTCICCTCFSKFSGFGYVRMQHGHD